MEEKNYSREKCKETGVCARITEEANNVLTDQDKLTLTNIRPNLHESVCYECTEPDHVSDTIPKDQPKCPYHFRIGGLNLCLDSRDLFALTEGQVRQTPGSFY